MRIVLWLSLFLCACSPEWNDHLEAGAFKLRYPAGWRISHEANAVVFRAPVEEHASFVVAVVPRAESGRTRDRQMVLRGIEAQHQAMPGYQALGGGKRTVARRTADAAAIVFTKEEIEYQREQVVLELEQSFLVLYATAPRGAFPRDVVNQILDSVEVLR